MRGKVGRVIRIIQKKIYYSIFKILNTFEQYYQVCAR